MCNHTLARSAEKTTDSMNFVTVNMLQELCHQESPQLTPQEHI